MRSIYELRRCARIFEAQARLDIKKAIKRPGELRAALNIPEDKNLYDMPVGDIVDYAAISTANLRRVYFARTLSIS